MLNKDQLKKLLEEKDQDPRVFYTLLFVVYPPKDMSERNFSIMMKNIARKLTGQTVRNINTKTRIFFASEIDFSHYEDDDILASRLMFAYPTEYGKTMKNSEALKINKLIKKELDANHLKYDDQSSATTKDDKKFGGREEEVRQVVGRVELLSKL